MSTQEISLWGERIRLNSEHSPEFIQRVADYLNERLEDESSNNQTQLTTKIVVLRAAFRIAAEYLLVQEQLHKLEDILETIENELENNSREI